MKPRITRVPPAAAAPTWQVGFDALSRAVNVALADVADAFEGKGNMPTRAFVEDVFDVDGGFPRYLLNPVRSRPLGMVVVYAENLTDGGTFSSAVFPTWDVSSDGRLAVRGVSGLSSGKRYRIRYEVSS
jgi:hypothetical protein